MKRLKADSHARPAMPAHPDRGNAPARKRAERAGRRAELYARLWLRLKGWRCLGMRVKTARGELDLVVARGHTIAFVEVKNRSRLVDARNAVSDAQWRRVSAASDIWMSGRERLGGMDHRFDLIAVSGPRIRHVPDAWRS